MKSSIVITSIVLLTLAASASAETRWFVVSEINPERDESYLLPLSLPEDIEQARRLIEQGPGGDVGSIANVEIAAGADGFNRNVLADDQPLWSWHVVAFHGFADLAIELCDGWPGFVEQDVDAFIQNTEAMLCFWGYTVTAELDEAPAFAINRELRGGWFDRAMPGQGLMLDVFEATGQLFAAWFTFEQDAGSSKIGSPDHRWLTGQGSYTGSLATLDLTLTTGGRFAGPQPVENSDPGSIGSIELRFDDCNHGQVDYQFVDGPSGSFPIMRLSPDPSCQPDQ